MLPGLHGAGGHCPLTNFLTPNGKVDRASLPAPTAEPVHDGAQRTSKSGGVAAGGDLGTGSGIDGHRRAITFALGGYSCWRCGCSARSKQTFGARLPMAVLFRSADGRQLADVLADEGCTVHGGSLVAIQPEETTAVVRRAGSGQRARVRTSPNCWATISPLRIAGSRFGWQRKPFMRVEEMRRYERDPVGAAVWSLISSEAPRAGGLPCESHSSSRRREKTLF